MLLHPRSPARVDELLEARFIEDDSAPEPVVEFENGLRMLFSRALEEYVVEWADEHETGTIQSPRKGS